MLDAVSTFRTTPDAATGPARRTANNFGALRLFFAVLVILSHAPELVDGTRSREILTRIFGTLSFGELGVDAFFLISGYLITKSWHESHSAIEYVFKRVLRIYPGYVLAYLVCVVLLAPVVTRSLAGPLHALDVSDLVFLLPPRVNGAFAGTPVPELNGSMWTIAYEFRCYLLVLAVGWVGLFSRRFAVAAATVCLLAVGALQPHVWGWYPERLEPVFGLPDLTVRFAAVFLCGALFYLYQDRIRYDWRLAALAGCGWAALMFSPHFAEAGVAVFGGYVLFWFALTVDAPILARVGRRVDLSYGVYLYGWPVQKLLIWLYPGISPWLVSVETTAIAGLLAFGSWRLVEQPFLGLKAALRPA